MSTLKLSSCNRFVVCFGSALLLLLVAVATGCGGNSASASGTVTLDGTPLTKGDLAFHPVSSGPMAYGTIDAGGKYSLSTGTAEGLVPGEYVVTVVVAEEVVSPPGAAPLPPKVTSPVKYSDKSQSPLRVTIASGANDIPLALTSN